MNFSGGISLLDGGPYDYSSLCTLKMETSMPSEKVPWFRLFTNITCALLTLLSYFLHSYLDSVMSKQQRNYQLLRGLITLLVNHLSKKLEPI